jgi:type II secretory pathway component PulJ
MKLFKKGITILEMFIAISILLLLISSAFSLLTRSRDTWLTGEARIALRQELMKTVVQMEKELKQTRPSKINLSIASSSSSISFKTPQDNDNDTTVLDSSGNVEWSGNITYLRNNANQLVRNMSGTASILANNISALQFTRPSSPDDILQINITARKTTATQRVIQDTETILVKMRN